MSIVLIHDIKIPILLKKLNTMDSSDIISSLVALVITGIGYYFLIYERLKNLEDDVEEIKNDKKKIFDNYVSMLDQKSQKVIELTSRIDTDLNKIGSIETHITDLSEKFGQFDSLLGRFNKDKLTQTKDLINAIDKNHDTREFLVQLTDLKEHLEKSKHDLKIIKRSYPSIYKGFPVYYKQSLGIMTCTEQYLSASKSREDATLVCNKHALRKNEIFQIYNLLNLEDTGRLYYGDTIAIYSSYVSKYIRTDPQKKVLCSDVTEARSCETYVIEAKYDNEYHTAIGKSVMYGETVCLKHKDQYVRMDRDKNPPKLFADVEHKDLWERFIFVPAFDWKKETFEWE